MRPINLGTPAVNTYLFPTLAGYLLVDTGYSGGESAFFRRLSRKKIDLNELQWVFLTHAHDDHAGFLNEVLLRTRARVLLHPLAAERLRRGKNPDIGGPPNGRAAARSCSFGMGIRSANAAATDCAQLSPLKKFSFAICAR